MQMTKPGWSVSDHIFGKRKPYEPCPEWVGLFFTYVMAFLIVAATIVGGIYILKTIWMAV